MVIHAAAKTDTGCCRDKNEDAFFVDSENGLYIICDGLGGHLAGEIASQKAIEYTVEFLTKAREQRILPRKKEVDFREVWGQLVVEAIESCCDEVIRFAESHPDLTGMASTITVVQFVEGVAFVGYLGDSRLYLKHADVAKQLTLDHTLFEEFSRTNPNWLELNHDKAALKRFKHILTRCVGRERDFEVDSFCFQLAEGDVLLLCTDGLSNYFLDEETIVSLLNESDSDTAAKSLIDFANTSGGRDNITAVVVRVVRLDEPEYCDFIIARDQQTGSEATQEWRVN